MALSFYSLRMFKLVTYQLVLSQSDILVEMCYFRHIVSQYSGGAVFVNNSASSVIFNINKLEFCSSLNSLGLFSRTVGGGAYVCACKSFICKCVDIVNCSCNGDGTGYYSLVGENCSHQINQTSISYIPQIGRCPGHIDRGNIVANCINSTKSSCPDFSGIVFGSVYKNTLVFSFGYSANNIKSCPFHVYSTYKDCLVSYVSIINNSITGSAVLFSFSAVSATIMEYVSLFGNGYPGQSFVSLVLKNCYTDINSFCSSLYITTSCYVGMINYVIFTTPALDCRQYFTNKVSYSVPSQFFLTIFAIMNPY